MQQKSNIFSSAKERLLQYLEYKGITPYRFSKDTGLSNGFLNSGKSINSDNLQLLSTIYIDINLIWLITGEGGMLLEKKLSPKSSPELSPSVENSDKKLLPELLPKLLLCDENCKVNCEANCKVEEKYIPNDKTNESPNEINAQVGERCIPSSEISLREDVDMSVAKHVERGGIPLLPINAAAGLLSGSGVQIMEYECEQYVIPSFKDADFMIRINGDSMEPKFYSGDIVACQRLPLDTFFQWNRVYVIDSEQGVLVKRVKHGSDKEHIKLVSENAEYEPFELHLSQLSGLGRVIGHVRLE